MADRWQLPYADPHLTPETPSASAIIVYCVLGLCAVHQILHYLDYPILSPPELVWNALVFLAPSRLVLDSAKRRELQQSNMWSQTHAAKSEALRQVMGLGGTSLTHKLTGGEGLMRKMSSLGSGSGENVTSDAPPGLGNWDNSCYQNSVLQGLAALGSLRTYLGTAIPEQEGTTGSSLQETIMKLNDARNNGKHLWTPAKLKSMSSWQQQDAQEYFSKIMDELDKEAVKAAQARRKTQGLEAVVKEGATHVDGVHNPLEGLLAQRVACTKCGFSEGLSMIPFNCLTVPLGSAMEYDVRDCLDEYTKLEEITEVECSKCTLLRYEGQCKQMLPAEKPRTEEGEAVDSGIKQALSLPPEVRAQVAQRLQAIQRALDDDDFTDKTLNESCQIPKKGRVSSTKTRQAVVGRAPQSLVVHVNRSVFDEMTGIQRKNHASVRYPMILNLGDWMLSERPEAAASPSLLDGSDSSGPRYRLKAVVQHYGRHENGHYICYRQHPVRRRPESETDEQELKWWRLSDEDVSAVTEDEVLGQHGVFMLFYERDAETQEHAAEPSTTGAAESKSGLTEAVDSAQSMLMDDDVAEATPPVLEEVLANIDEELKPKHDPAPIAVPQQQPSPPPTPSPAPSFPPQPQSKPPTAESSEPNITDMREAQTVSDLKTPSTPALTMRTAHSRRISKSRKDSIGKKSLGDAFRPMAAT